VGGEEKEVPQSRGDSKEGHLGGERPCNLEDEFPDARKGKKKNQFVLTTQVFGRDYHRGRIDGAEGGGETTTTKTNEGEEDKKLKAHTTVRLKQLRGTEFQDAGGGTPRQNEDYKERQGQSRNGPLNQSCR